MEKYYNSKTFGVLSPGTSYSDPRAELLLLLEENTGGDFLAKERSGLIYRLFGYQKRVRGLPNEVSPFKSLYRRWVGPLMYSDHDIQSSVKDLVIYKAYLSQVILEEIKESLEKEGLPLSVKDAPSQWKEEEYRRILRKAENALQSFRVSQDISDSSSYSLPPQVKDFLTANMGVRLDDNFLQVLKEYKKRYPEDSYGLKQEAGQFYIQLAPNGYGMGDGYSGMIGFSLDEGRIFIIPKDGSGGFDWSYISESPYLSDLSAHCRILESKGLNEAAETIKELELYSVPLQKIIAISKELDLKLSSIVYNDLGEEKMYEGDSYVY